MNKKRNILQYIVLTAASLFSVFPLYYMLCGATNTSVEVMEGKLVPGLNLIENFRSLISYQDLGSALWNSLRNSVILTVLSLLVCSIAGYGFEIYHDKGKDAVMMLLLTAMMIPFAAIMIPLFRMFSKLGMVNSMAAFMLPTISTPFLIMLFRQSSRAFPHDIIEAARMDGLSEMGIFFKIFMPTMKSTYAAAMTITFMNAWNNYLWPLIALQSPEKRTLPLILSTMGSSYTPDYGMMMVAVVIATIPTALIFFLMQKQFVAGMTGSVKG